MWIVALEAEIASDVVLTSDDVTDLIETIVDTIDKHGVVGSVGSSGIGKVVNLTVEVLVDEEAEYAALQLGQVAIDAAMQAAGLVEGTHLQKLTPSIIRQPTYA